MFFVVIVSCYILLWELSQSCPEIQICIFCIQQVAGKLIFFNILYIYTALSTISCIFFIDLLFWGRLWQVTGKLNYAHVGTYFMYRGAVVGSNGLSNPRFCASFINLETLPDEVSFNPNLSLRELFVSCSP